MDLEVVVQELATFDKRLVDQRFTVEVDDIKRKEAETEEGERKRGRGETDLTLMSSSLTCFLERVLRIWKGRIFCSARSKATASQSRMHEVTPSLAASLRCATMSGNFSVVLSRLREKINISPPSFMWICVRSPSYFHSAVNALPSRRSKISSTPGKISFGCG